MRLIFPSTFATLDISFAAIIAEPRSNQLANLKAKSGGKPTFPSAPG